METTYVKALTYIYAIHVHVTLDASSGTTVVIGTERKSEK
jgi:hypothetical protein